MTPNDFQSIFQSFVDRGVEFVVVGGVAATMHGSPLMTQDLDVCYRRSGDNIARMVEALRPFNPRLRGAPRDVKFLFDVQTIRAGLNFTFETDAGDVDCLGEITGVGMYEEALRRSVSFTLFGLSIRFLDLDTLIVAKRAAGRRKDLEAIAELEVIRERSRKP